MNTLIKAALKGFHFSILKRALELRDASFSIVG
jgi:hypothetical protein